MSFADTTSYFIALVAILLAPGPMALLLITRAASDDVRGAVGFAIGASLGNVLIVTAVCLGMSIWLSSVPEVLNYSKYLMLAYLAYVARGMWMNGFSLDGEAAPRRSGFLLAGVAGLVTCLLSPYMIILFPLMIPEVLDISTIQMPGYLILVLVTLAAEILVSALLIGLAAQVRRLSRSDHARKLMNRGLASFLVLGGTALALM